MKQALAVVVFGMIVSLVAASPSSAVTLGQVDDFQDGTVQGWAEGFVSPNPPTNMATGGPAGMGDRYLKNVSAGGFGAGSRLAMFNVTQWAGDYLAAGVSRVEMQMANFGATTLRMRVAIQGSGTRYASTTAFVLPPDGVWRAATFNLTAADLTNVGGLASVSGVLAAVDTLRIISATAPAWQGDAIAATLGVDNIRAAGGSPAPPPVPDGTFGSAMGASKGAPDGSTIGLTWDVSTCPAGGYHIVFGAVANVASLTVDGGVCAIGTAGSFSWMTVPAGSLWFLVVGDDGGTTEGSWGKNSAGGQRGGAAPSGTCGMASRVNTGTCP